jgi:putative hemolysin
MMQTIAPTLASRYPRLFRAVKRPFLHGLLRGLGRWSGLEMIRSFLAEHGHLRGLPFVEAALRFLDLRYTVDQVEYSRVPETGRLLIVANHPCGALDALALLDFVGRIRSDVRIVANDLLAGIESLAPLILPVRILGGQPQVSDLRRIETALAQGQCVIIFPAGEVSRLGLRGIADRPWRRGLMRFALATDAPVLPVQIEARNSALFYGASALFRPAGTALLPREILRQRSRRIGLRIGQAHRLEPGADPAATLRALRRATDSIGTWSSPVQKPNGDEPLADAVDPKLLAIEIATLERLGDTADGKQIRAGRLPPGSPLLCEIGRLRELTFRGIGEGTGRRLDLDRYDAWYEQIVLWDAGSQRIAGAYRVANSGRILAERGLGGLYTSTLFEYADAMLPRMAAGLELGRSFVAPDYQGSRSIDLLWQGIGAYLRRHPDIRYLFGAVSISASLPLPAREKIVAHYGHYYGARQQHARARRPFTPIAPAPHPELPAADAFRRLKIELDALGASVPMLYKQYVDLCEPDGVRFLAFGVDPDFSDAVDGLIELDLAHLRPKKRMRYLGAADEAAADNRECLRDRHAAVPAFSLEIS